MRRPLVAIVGRPNVGKSSIFNRLLGERCAIVHDMPGVTRDRLVRTIRDEVEAVEYDLMDTGGIGIVDCHALEDQVEYQVETGVAAADLLLFVVDTRDGLTLLDERVGQLLRRVGKPLLLVANKCENREAAATLPDFASLGHGEPLPFSAHEGLGARDLNEWLRGHVPTPGPADLTEGTLRIAVIGRRNVGKSSFVNRLIGEERLLVSDVPGTTRDAVDVQIEHDGSRMTLVDTAGFHRKSKVANPAEFFSLSRSDNAVRRADVVLLFLDCTESIARMDQQLARTAIDRHKPAVVVLTKSDLVPDCRLSDWKDRLDRILPHLRDAPRCLISNVTGRAVKRALDLAVSLAAEAGKRVGTGELNRALDQVMAHSRFRGRGAKPKVYYATQFRVSPPTFLLFVNDPRLFTREAMRTIVRGLSKRLGYERVPVRLVLRDKKRARV